ncbi:MAG: roadblock/LC7 domain-containing protein [Verrucomicrobiae bacterium]|nr:roadblock/LC7 domain-containing protein [Verrucomicrobiae bacterium]MCP5542236.1 roadblock/LC7 domain-containing protein [Akkermansiaceae bacterium]
MAASKSDALKTILNTLSASSGDIEASAVVSTDGLMIASNFPAGLDEDRVAAMSAALLAMGERSAAELERGELDQVFIKGARGNVVMLAAGHEGVLTTLTTPNAKLGLVFLDMKRAAEEISRII